MQRLRRFGADWLCRFLPSGAGRWPHTWTQSFTFAVSTSLETSVLLLSSLSRDGRGAYQGEAT